MKKILSKDGIVLLQNNKAKYITSYDLTEADPGFEYLSKDGKPFRTAAGAYIMVPKPTEIHPNIQRGIDDAGENLNLDLNEIETLMDQMITEETFDNLKLWIHSGLSKIRISGEDTFIEKGYDLSGNENDAIQTTEGNQPKLIDDSIKFNNNDDYLNAGNDSSINSLGIKSISLWFKTPQLPPGGHYYHMVAQRNQNNLIWVLQLKPDKEGHVDMLHGFRSAGFLPDPNTWYNLVTVSTSEFKHEIYINGYEIEEYRTQDVGGSYGTNTNVEIAIGNRVGGGRVFPGYLNDIRIFDVELTPTQILANYNQSKSNYE